jgi:endoglucanase
MKTARPARKSLALVFGVAVAASAAARYPDYNTNPIPPDMQGMGYTAKQVAAHIKLGFNIGNTLEAPGGETAWGNPKISEELIKQVKKTGFDAVRLPVAWNVHADPDTAKIDEAWMARVKEVVRMCLDNDLFVVLNIHWDDGWLEKNVSDEMQDEVNARQKALWQQIATNMRDFDGHLLFASANEPDAEDSAQVEILLSYHQTFVDAVRATGGRNAYRTLVVQGPKTNMEQTADLMRKLPEDTAKDRLMVEVHCYEPYPFSLMEHDESWGKPAFYWGKNNRSRKDEEHNSDRNSEREIKDHFKLMKRAFAAKGIPVVLGEYCAMDRSRQLSGEELELHLDSRDDWHEFITKEALANGMIPFFWDTGGVLDRKNATVRDERTLKALKQGAGK